MYDCDTLGVSFPLNGGLYDRMVWNRKHLVVGQVFMITLLYQGSVTSNLSRPNFTLSSNLQALTLTDGGFSVTESAPNPNVNTGSSILLLSLAVRVTSNNMDASLTGTATGLIPTGTTAVKIRIMQVSGADPRTLGNVVV